MLTLSRRVPDDMFFDVLSDLITTRKATTTLTDGRQADIHLLTPEDGYHPLTEQPGLPAARIPRRRPTALRASGSGESRASSQEEAQAIITDVVRNNRKPPRGSRLASTATQSTVSTSG